MKVICIEDKYRGFILSEYITINKIYNVLSDSLLVDANNKRVFRIRCDDGYQRAYPLELLKPLQEYRNEKIDIILN